jgi:hypothetical protein
VETRKPAIRASHHLAAASQRRRLVNSPAAGGPVLTVPDAPLAFHVMVKPTGAVCNLDCE